jgi:hypothetical protein
MIWVIERVTGVAYHPARVWYILRQHRSEDISKGHRTPADAGGHPGSDVS